ncbi:ABC transporter permease [Leucobacter allii]|uniref:ABC transporter permease n=1 Tax=Leucobacter allii TaxID=2932247 RepID=UPI001FD3C422|nr:ABC transporter permease [Leucobacter allii]UOR01538.1 ABC transporter permease [Leucobacter allii]
MSGSRIGSTTPQRPDRGGVTGPATVIGHKAGRRARGRVAALIRQPGLLLSLCFMALVCVAVVAPQLLAPGDPMAAESAAALHPPGTAGHLLGTDLVGRDLYTRIVFGTRDSLSAAFLAMLISLVGGSLLGLLAGYFGGRSDAIIMRAVDVMLAFPALLLAMAIITAIGFGTLAVAIAVGVVGVAAMTRLMRSEVLRVRRREFVEAAGLSGASWATTMVRHVLPNAWGPAIVLAVLDFGTAILAISSLSFLGFGAPPPSPEWGSLISAGRSQLATAWWLSTFPGAAIALVVLATNRIARIFDGGQR